MDFYRVLLSDFYNSILEKGNSEFTARAYQDDALWFLRQFTPSCLQDISNISKKSIEQSLQHENLKQSTKIRRISGLKKFYDFLQQYQIPNIGKIPAPKKNESQTLPKIIQNSDYAQMRSYPVGENQFIQLRNKALIDSIYCLGLNCTALHSLYWKNIDFESRHLFHPLHRCAILLDALSDQSFQEYSKVFHSHYQNHPQSNQLPIFINKYSQPISNRSIHKIVKKFGEKISLDNLSPRDLRWNHMFNSLKQGINAEDVSRYAGLTSHASPFRIKNLFNKIYKPHPA